MIDEDMVKDIETQALIVVRLEEKFGVAVVPACVDECVGRLGFSFPEFNETVEMPYYNSGEVVRSRKPSGELLRLKPGQFVVRFGEYALAGTVDQLRQVWLYTYALTRALQVSEAEEAGV